MHLSDAQKKDLSFDLELSTRSIGQETNPLAMSRLAERVLHRHVDRAQRRAIDDFGQFRNAPYLLLKNLVSTEGLPPTPVDDTSPAEEGWRVQAAALLGLLTMCGMTAASFKDEMGGRLCHMVMPAKNSDRSYARSTKALNFHTEVVNGYFIEEDPRSGAPISPESFGLVCLRNPGQVATTVLPIDKLLDTLTRAERAVLAMPHFTARSQSSFDREMVVENVPVLIRMANGLWGMRFSSSKLVGINDQATRVLEKFRNNIEAARFESVVLHPGDALILNNRICLHGRTAIRGTEQFDGMDRWLVRIYGYQSATTKRMRFAGDRSHVMLVDDTGADAESILRRPSPGAIGTATSQT